MYLLDICVFSEFSKPKPSEKVLAWARTVRESTQYLSVLVLGELERGILLMPSGERRFRLTTWLAGLYSTHRDRLVPVDAEVAHCWASICADAATVGKTPPAMDSLVAAQALSRGLILVTHNTDDFEGLPVKLLNPWE